MENKYSPKGLWSPQVQAVPLGAARPTALAWEEKQVQTHRGWKVLIVCLRGEKSPCNLKNPEDKDDIQIKEGSGPFLYSEIVFKNSGKSILFYPLPTTDCREHTETMRALRLRS